MLSTLRPSQNVALVGVIAPQSAAVGTLTSGWISMSQFEALLAVVQNGTLGASATVDAKVQQATDSSGTGAKDLAVTVMTQNVKATDDNKVNLINVLERDLDIANGFGWVRLSVTVGTAASLLAAQIFGVNARYAPENTLNSTSVKQIVN